MNKSEYDTRDEIRAVCSSGSYTELYALLQARRDAHYVRSERLAEWVVLGRLHLDSCGNAAVITSPSDPSWAKEPVYTWDDAFRAMRQAGLDGRIVASHQPIPTSDLVCPCCNQRWDIYNFTDYTIDRSSETVPLSHYIGRTLAEAQTLIEQRTNARYISSEYPLRNDKYIDLTPEEKYPTLKKNEFGHLRRISRNTTTGETHGDIDPKTHIIEKGDEAEFQTLTFKHQGCNKAELERQTYADFSKAFHDAGMTISATQQVPNEYGSTSYRGPWYIITTQFGPFKVGWRKRVIELNWTAAGEDYLGLFNDVKDTKDHTGLHAYSYQDLMKYLTRISEHHSGIKTITVNIPLTSNQGGGE